MARCCWIVSLLILTLTLHGVDAVAPKLARYNIEADSITVSGISSGAAMATQMHVAFSSLIKGIGMMSGPPYMCARLNMVDAALSCMSQPSLISVESLFALVSTYALTFQIDSTSNLRNSKVFLYHGNKDTVVEEGVLRKAKTFYENYVTPSNILTSFTLPAGHTVPTMNYGGECGKSTPPFVSNCQHDLAYDLLNHLYGGGLKRPDYSAPLTGQLSEFDQSEFFYFSSPLVYSMDTTGFVYVPNACKTGKKCKLHLAFHGCLQSRHDVGSIFAANSGYNQVADANDIVVLYPQATSTAMNLVSCWDWFGYTGIAYATKNGFQPTAIKRMIDKVK